MIAIVISLMHNSLGATAIMASLPKRDLCYDILSEIFKRDIFIEICK